MQGADTFASDSGRPARELTLQLLVLGCWLVAFGAAAVLEYAPHASLWFPPAAVTFAAVLVMGPRVMPILFLACAFVVVLDRQIFQRNFDADEVLLAAASFGVLHTLAYGSLALMMRAATHGQAPFGSLPQVNAFLIGGVIAAGAPAVLGSLSLVTTGAIDAADLTLLIAPRWIGDFAGLMTLGPLMVFVLVKASTRLGLPPPMDLHQLIHPDLPWQRAAAKLLALGLITTSALALAAAFPDSNSLLFLLFLALPVQHWIVHSESTWTSLLGILLFSLLLAAAAGIGDLGNQALMLQFITISLAVSSHLGLAVPALYRDNERMRQWLTHDSLTGALTRNFFEDAAREGLRQSCLRAQASCLVRVDLDDLKLINEQFGHTAGDSALQHLTRICSASLRPGQPMGRIGGGEFALFLGECGRAEAQGLVNEMARQLAEAPDPGSGRLVTASFGLAEYSPDTGQPDYDALLAAADAAMYRHKRA